MSRPTKQMRHLRERNAMAIGRACAAGSAGNGVLIAGVTGACAMEGTGSTSARRSVGLLGVLTAAVVGLGLAASLLLVLVPAAAHADCPNDEFRTGPSANLPDCRAYELVSPADSGGIPTGAYNFNQPTHEFPSQLISPDGRSLSYQTAGGGLSGLPGNGFADRYVATRTEGEGWTTDLAGPTELESQYPAFGGNTSDQGLYFFETGNGDGATNTIDRGSLITPTAATVGVNADYLRLPGGAFELIAKGSLGANTEANGYYISPAGDHVIFGSGATQSSLAYTPAKLEPAAADGGLQTIYDRSPGGPTRVASLLPGEVTPSTTAHYEGSSRDGGLIAFSVAGDPSLYVRVNGDHTDQVTAGANTPAGIFNGYAFYADADSGSAVNQTPADLFSYDIDAESTTQITDVGDARFVNVSDDGSHVYFVSNSQIGADGTAGQPNLYLWQRGGDTTYVATLVADDVTGDSGNGGTGTSAGNMTRWTNAIASGRPAVALNRSSADGSVLIFESRAQLTAYDNAGFGQVYRYDATTEAIECLSCAGAGPATASARIQSRNGQLQRIRPVYPHQVVPGISEDADTVVFEADASLVSRDTNGTTDVYRWRKGDGVKLITTGRANRPSFIYAMTPDASSIAFTTGQDLTPGAQNGETTALYTARVDGGVASDAGLGPGDCTGDACQDDPTGPPADGDPGSTGVFHVNPNAKTGNANCSRLDKKARKAHRMSRELRRKARKADSRKRTERLRSRATRQKQKSKRFTQQAKRCRGGSQ